MAGFISSFFRKKQIQEPDSHGHWRPNDALVLPPPPMNAPQLDQNSADYVVSSDPPAQESTLQVELPSPQTASTKAPTVDSLIPTPSDQPPTWEHFWLSQDQLGHAYAAEMRAHIKHSVEEQAAWLQSVVALVPTSPKSALDISGELRGRLSRAKVTGGAISAAAAGIISDELWSRVPAERVDETRAEFKALAETRPAVNLEAMPPKVAKVIDGSQAVSKSATTTWQEFWSAQDQQENTYPTGMRAGIERSVEQHAEWLQSVLDLLPGSIHPAVDIAAELRLVLSKSKVTDGTLSAAIAGFISREFWPKVPSDDGHIRAGYDALTKSRPTPKLLAVRIAVPNKPALTPTVADIRASIVLDELCRRHSLADEKNDERLGAIWTRINDIEEVNPEWEPRTVCDEAVAAMSRIIDREQRRYRVNAKRGKQTEDALWKSAEESKICNCPACQASRFTSGSIPDRVLLDLGNPEQQLERDLKAALVGRVPLKYLDILRTELVVQHNFVTNPSTFKCWAERSLEMSELITTLFDTAAANPEKAYVNALVHHLEDDLAARELAIRQAHEEAMYGHPLDLPASRQILSWQDAEENARDWMQFMGFHDATLSAGGADGGVDVIAYRAVAQVKREAVAIGSPVLQQFYGAAAMYPTAEERLFFSGSGYSRSALQVADTLGIALFIYRLDGRMEPENDRASALLSDPVEI